LPFETRDWFVERRLPLALAYSGLLLVDSNSRAFVWMQDLDALLNKKLVKEVQKSKEGEELLELRYKPTAKASAVDSKVSRTFSPNSFCI
jgi:hypothetical protein